MKYRRPNWQHSFLPLFILLSIMDRAIFLLLLGICEGCVQDQSQGFLGTNYYQIVYRAVVELRDPQGNIYPGVFFLRSDSNDPIMSYFGNRLTEFRFHYFHTGAINLFQRQDQLLVTVQTAEKAGDLVASLRNHGPADQLEPAPGFVSVQEEKTKLIQLFHAYAFDPARHLIYDLEIERGEWHIQRLELLDIFSAFFMELPFSLETAKPVSHVYIQECGYIWKPVVALPEEQFI